MKRLLSKIEEKRAIIAILGLGHTGLQLACEFGGAGFYIIGIDIDKKKIAALNKHQSYLPFLAAKELFAVLDKKHFRAESGFSALAEADVIIISVPTPLGKGGTPDLTPLQSAVKAIAKNLRKEQLVILQSTSFPGTTAEVILPYLTNKTGLKVGKDFFLATVPERADPGTQPLALRKVPRIAGGVSAACLKLAKTLYEHITSAVFPCSSTQVAEATKTYENAFRLINISFVNEMKIFFEKMDINIDEVIQAASTKPYGFMPFYPGPGVGGECIPVDPLYLINKGKEHGAHSDMIELALSINFLTEKYYLEKIAKNLKARGKKVKNSRILILGLAFKKDVSDIRLSPSLNLFHALEKKGAKVSYNDPYVPNYKRYASTSLSKTYLQSCDLVVIGTDHSAYDWSLIFGNSPHLIDTRGVHKS